MSTGKDFTRTCFGNPESHGGRSMFKCEFCEIYRIDLTENYEVKKPLKQ